MKDEDVFKYTFNKWGTYQTLQKQALVAKYFMDRKEQKIRQKTVIEHFKDKMSAGTCRDILYRLLEKEVILEDQHFKGTYLFNLPGFREVATDVDLLAKAILGEEIYHLARFVFEEKYLQSQKLEEKKEQEDSYYRNSRR